MIIKHTGLLKRKLHTLHLQIGVNKPIFNVRDICFILTFRSKQLQYLYQDVKDSNDFDKNVFIFVMLWNRFLCPNTFPPRGRPSIN